MCGVVSSGSSGEAALVVTLERAAVADLKVKVVRRASKLDDGKSDAGVVDEVGCVSAARAVRAMATHLEGCSRVRHDDHCGRILRRCNVFDRL